MSYLIPDTRIYVKHYVLDESKMDGSYDETREEEESFGTEAAYQGWLKDQGHYVKVISSESR